MNIYNEFRKTAINRYSKTALVMMNDEGETKEYTFGQTLQQADVFAAALKPWALWQGIGSVSPLRADLSGISHSSPVQS